MKKSSFLIVCLLVMSCLGLLPTLQAQPRYGIYYEELCWRTPAGADSSIVRYVLTPSQYEEPITLFFTNANADTISVAGGTLSLCWCGVTPDTSEPPAFDPNTCIQLLATSNPFKPTPPELAKGVGYNGFVSGVSSASQITVELDGVVVTDWTFDPNTGVLTAPTTGNYYGFPQDGITHTLDITATNAAGTTVLNCTSPSN